MILQNQELLEKSDEQHPVSVSEIISHLEANSISAERKSIYDDMEALRQYGIDVEMRRNKHFGYYVGSRSFEMPELKLLVDAVQSSKFITKKKSDQLIKKVESLASVHEAKKLQRQVYVANRIKSMNESIYYNIDRIHEAIFENRKISFKYFEWTISGNELKPIGKRFRRNGLRYELSPWSLTWDDQNYYMIAYDHISDQIKHFRVDKMTDIHMMVEERDGQEHFRRFDMALYSQGLFGMYGGKEALVTLAFAEKLIGVVVDRFGNDIQVSPYEAGFFKIHLKVMVSPQFLSWVFSFGKEAKILSPEWVVESFREQASETLQQYQ